MERIGLAGMSWEEIERRAIVETLYETEGNRRKAAQILGVCERTIYNKVRKYRLTDEIKGVLWYGWEEYHKRSKKHENVSKLRGDSETGLDEKDSPDRS